MFIKQIQITAIPRRFAQARGLSPEDHLEIRVIVDGKKEREIVITEPWRQCDFESGLDFLIDKIKFKLVQFVKKEKEKENP